MLTVLSESGWNWPAYSRPNRLPLLVEQNDIVVVVTRQILTYLPVADDECVVDLAQVGDLDHVAKLCDLAVLGELDAIGLVGTLHSLGVVTVVHILEFGEEDHCPGLEEEEVGGKGGGARRDETAQRKHSTEAMLMEYPLQRFFPFIAHHTVL